jgi:hypothetical protein
LIPVLLQFGVVLAQAEETRDPWEWWLGFIIVVVYVAVRVAQYLREQRKAQTEKTWEMTQAKVMKEQFERASEAGKKFVRKPRVIDPEDEKARAGVAVDMNRFFRKACPVCGDEMFKQDVLAACVDCGTASHWSCARRRGGCATVGCDSFVYLHPWRIVARWSEVVIYAKRYLGSTCQVCDVVILAEDDIAICINCDYAYHMKCASRAACMKNGCKSLVYLHPSGRVKTWRRMAVTEGAQV